jgi:hypothetical protein
LKSRNGGELSPTFGAPIGRSKDLLNKSA